jgi:hypothetical protein
MESRDDARPDQIDPGEFCQGRSVESRTVSKLGAWRPSRAAAVSTPTKLCSGWNVSDT